MRRSLSEIKQKYKLRDFIKEPLDTADVLILLMSFSIFTTILRGFSYGIGNPIMILIDFISYAIIFSGMVLIISDINKEKYLKPLALLFLALILITSVLGTGIRTQTEGDVSAFSVYSAELLLQGENPYEKSMAPAFEKFEELDSGTPLMNGGKVESLSYPSLSFLYLVPQVALNNYNVFFSSFPFALLIGLLLVVDVHPKYSILGALAVQFLLNLVNFSPVDFTWLALFMLSVRFWLSRRYVSLFLLGLSFSFKQIPWFVAPFLAVWVIKENEDLASGAKEVLKQFGFLASIFLVPNIPFIIDNPLAWLRGVFTPMSSTGTLPQVGEGLVQISLKMSFLPNDFFNYIMLLFIVCLTCFYWINFREVKWMAWIAPSIILWFNYRSADKYLAVIIPLLAYTYFVKNKETIMLSDYLTKVKSCE